MEENKIAFIFNNDETVSILLNGKNKLNLNIKENTEISAKDIFNSFEYEKNNKYQLLELKSKEEVKIHQSKYVAIEKIYDFYKNLINDINEIEEKDDLTQDIELDV